MRSSLHNKIMLELRKFYTEEQISDLNQFLTDLGYSNIEEAYIPYMEHTLKELAKKFGQVEIDNALKEYAVFSSVIMQVAFLNTPITKIEALYNEGKSDDARILLSMQQYEGTLEDFLKDKSNGFRNIHHSLFKIALKAAKGAKGLDMADAVLNGDTWANLLGADKLYEQGETQKAKVALSAAGYKDITEILKAAAQLGYKHLFKHITNNQKIIDKMTEDGLVAIAERAADFNKVEILDKILNIYKAKFPKGGDYYLITSDPKTNNTFVTLTCTALSKAYNHESVLKYLFAKSYVSEYNATFIVHFSDNNKCKALAHRYIKSRGFEYVEKYNIDNAVSPTIKEHVKIAKITDEEIRSEDEKALKAAGFATLEEALSVWDAFAADSAQPINTASSSSLPTGVAEPEGRIKFLVTVIAKDSSLIFNRESGIKVENLRDNCLLRLMYLEYLAEMDPKISVGTGI